MKKLLFALLFVFGCNTEKITEPELNVSGHYQEDALGMILFLQQSGTRVEADLHWSGYTIHLIGSYSSPDKQTLISGELYGNQPLSFNLRYKDATFGGELNYNGQMTTCYFRFISKLNKSVIHDQGGIQ